MSKLRQAAINGNLLDMVVLDLWLPRLSGLDGLQNIRTVSNLRQTSLVTLATSSPGKTSRSRTNCKRTHV